MSGKLVTCVIVCTIEKLKYGQKRFELLAEASRRKALEALAAGNQLEHDRLKMTAEWLQGLSNMMIPLEPVKDPDLHARFLRHAEIYIKRE